tara:strand:+ start:694 stop:2175 length:1482 start_codon:yes stop_codon:yes gene_type:complete
MNRQFRIPAQNNSPLIVNGIIQNNIVDFRLSGVVINPSETYISFRMNLNESTAHLSNLFLTYNGITEEHMKPHQCALVRDAYLFLGKHGKVEERLDADTINANMKLYVLDDDAMRKARKGNPFSRRDDVALSIIDNPFRILDKNFEAQQLEVECQIQLSDILDFCDNNEYLDLDAMGEMHLYLKMNWDFVDVGQNLGGNLQTPSFGGGVGSTAPFWTVGTPIYGEFLGVNATNDAVNSITTRRSYPEGLKFCPFFIKQRLLITLTLGANAPTVAPLNITGIALNTLNQVVLTLSGDIKAVGNNVAISNIAVEGSNAGSNAQIANMFNVREAELVVKSAVKSNKKQSYEYLVYDLEKDSSNQNTHKRTYEVPAGCVGVSILFPSDTGRLSSLTGLDGREVKISINTDDVSQGHVMRYGDSLERDLKERFFKNLGFQQVRNLQSYTGSITGSELGSEGVYLPIPESDMVQTLTLEIFNNAPVGSINIYKFRMVNL